MKFCENCEKEFDDNVNFCPLCGNPVSTREETIKFCRACGKELEEGTKFCPVCGNPTAYAKHINYYDNNNIYTVRPQGTGIILAFMIIGCIISALFYIFPLFWTIPMTIHFNTFSKARLKVSAGFKICTLIFVSPIAGIIMLCNKDI